MELAWTADGGAPPKDDTSASAPMGKLASAWDRSATTKTDRDTAMRDLYERCHADMVRFAAFLTGDPSLAEDVAHDAFAKVFAAWDRITDQDRIDAYLKATVVNVVRGGHRRQQVADRAEEPPALTLVRSAEDAAMDELGRQRTLDAVATLPLRQRACVVMRHWMRMTESEIATTLDLSVGSVRTHVKRGMHSLEKTLGESS